MAMIFISRLRARARVAFQVNSRKGVTTVLERNCTSQPERASYSGFEVCGKRLAHASVFLNSFCGSWRELPKYHYGGLLTLRITMTAFTNRETWLLAAVQLLKQIFAAKRHLVPDDCQVSCGFPSTGTRSHHIGQCWSRRSSTNERNQIFISPALGDPLQVLDTLVHELVHAVDNCENKHGKEFKKIALSVGLEGPMRSAGAGKALKEQLVKIADELGPYPHGQLKVHHVRKISAPRPRARCKSCGFEVPMYKRFLTFGPPLCPQHKTEMEQVGPWES